MPESYENNSHQSATAIRVCPTWPKKTEMDAWRIGCAIRLPRKKNTDQKAVGEKTDTYETQPRQMSPAGLLRLAP